MIAEWAEAALITAMILSFLFVPSYGALRKYPAVLWRFQKVLGNFLGFLIGVTFIGIIASFVLDDLRLITVIQNSEIHQPLFYKITAAWSNHEGSMLLWIVILTAMLVIFTWTQKSQPLLYKSSVTLLLGTMIFLMLCFLFFASNPFARLEFPADLGMGMNPILQDPAVAFHPPTLYMGYVGFMMPFILVAAARISHTTSPELNTWLRPWVQGAWTFLTLGITLGSWWAYYELGWGGWWFWDPVENISLMPWLIGIGLLHALSTKQKDNNTWVTVLSFCAFVMVLLGTFMIRSGFVTSVHSFALAQERALFLSIIVAMILGACAYILCIKNTAKQKAFIPSLSLESALMIQNTILVIMAFTVFLATIYPMILEALHLPKITIGAPYFHWVVVPMALPILLIMGFAYDLPSQKATSLKTLWENNKVLILTLLVGTLGTLLLSQVTYAMAWIFLCLSFWVLMTGAKALFGEHKISGMLLAHIGLGISILGMSVDTLYHREISVAMRPGEHCYINHYNCHFDQLDRQRTPTYMAEVAQVTLSHHSEPLGRITAEKRFYTAREILTSEVGLETLGFSQIYIALGEMLPDGRRLFKIAYHPFILLIWLGGLMMSLGGLMSLLARRKIK